MLPSKPPWGRRGDFGDSLGHTAERLSASTCQKPCVRSSQANGFALVQGFAERGVEVVLNGRDAGKLDGAAARLAAAGHKGSVAGLDVSASRQGRCRGDREILDILVSDAGMQFRSPLEDVPVEKWQQLLATNISSAFDVGQAVARHMIPRGEGKIINMASVQTELARSGIAP